MPHEKDWLRESAKDSLYGNLLYFFKRNPKYKMNPMEFVMVLHYLANEFAQRFQYPCPTKTPPEVFTN
ncbi:MAG: hypothetical protein J6Y07_04375 [Alphaproteobacteria bacterium]|nr:hypothetical protein [Alphaproteobacteria bacterium]